jgi:2-amino-4-hydroxy-6-hydroxymethyldihydropteridine diphosphokinase/dihydroneopterin aldolase/2-amino-4-hydroxy-6-hydroxymethyldihydropteridine diphosphokinase
MPGSSVTAFLALGSNLGDRTGNLDEAIRMLGETEGIEVEKISSFIVTAPVGYTDQPDFLNAVVQARTTLAPHVLLRRCNAIEAALHRKRIIHWGPRTIDVDILLYGNLVMEDSTLTIPHPRMGERGFVLGPLCEIAPHAVDPSTGMTAEQLFSRYRETR